MAWLMAATDVAFQDTISTGFGTTITNLAAPRSTSQNGLFWTKRKSFYLLICTHIPKRRESSCTAARTRRVLSSPDIFLISSGSKSITLITISATLVWNWAEMALRGYVFIGCLICLIATPWSILFIVQLKRNIILHASITRKSGTSFVWLLRNISVLENSTLQRYSDSYNKTRNWPKWEKTRTMVPAMIVSCKIQLSSNKSLRIEHSAEKVQLSVQKS